MTDNETRTTTAIDAAVEAVAAAIGRLGQATAADVAAAAGVPYSSTTKKLRVLRDAGRAESFDGDDRRTLWRLTATGRDTIDDAPAADDVETAVAATDADVATTGEAVDTEPDPTATPAPRVVEPSADAEPAPTDPAGSDHVDDDAPSPAAADDPAGDQPPAATDGAPTARRAGGTLPAAILDVLEADPDRQYRIGELCKAIDAANAGNGVAKASAGAVANAVTKLVGQQRVAQVGERPNRYQLAPTGD